MSIFRDYVRAKSREAAKAITDDMRRAGLFEQFKNPNGTYNGVKIFASLTGLSEADVEAEFRKAKERRK